jgi:translation initiation factor 3 subunit G
VDALPPSTTTTNKDGTKTMVSWRFNDDGKKVKTTRRIRFTVQKEVVNPRVAERKAWSKFGLSQKDGAGPASDTTSVGENIIFRPSTNWKKDAKEEKTEAGSMKDKLKDKKVKCRICNGEHFTARCPFKDTMAPVGEEGSADVAAGAADAVEGPGGLGTGKSSYVPPHMRNGASAGAGDRMGGGKFERDDLATLRVTNVTSLHIIPHSSANNDHRSPKWPKNKNSETCSSDLVGLRESFWRRIGKLVLLRVLLSSVSRRERTLRRLARRWMATVSSI